jgi:CRISPR-associated protein Csx16
MQTTTYLVTRHAGAVQWAAQTGLHYDVHLPHLLTLEQLCKGDIVIGTLPINMVCQLTQKGVRYMHLSLQIPSHLRGVELSAAQLEACHATLQEFQVIMA